jgi:hypothetical protein
MLAAAMSAPTVPGFVYCWSRHIDGEGRITGSGPRWTVEGRAFLQLAFLNVVGNGSGLLASSAALREIGGYDPSLRKAGAQGAEDLLTQIRIASRHPVTVVPEYLVGWRQVASSMSSDVEQMHRSCREVYRRLAEDGTPVPRRIERRMLASSALDLAEHYAFTGKFGRAMRWLSRALILDPVRSGSFVAYRIARSSRRKLGPAAMPIERLRFLDADPSARIITDAYHLDPLAEFVENIDLHRLKRLAKVDKSDELASR